MRERDRQNSAPFRVAPSTTILLPRNSSAALLVALLGHQLAAAQSMPDATTLRLKYVYYDDFQAGSKRMRINSPMAWVEAPLGKSTSFEGSTVYDSVAGASALYLDTLSGASGLGIADNRYAGNATITEYFDGYSIGVGGAYSGEDDYESRSANVQVRTWSEDKNTVFAFGASRDWDIISSTNDSSLHETRQVDNFLLGVTQVVTPTLVTQSNITGSFGSGYYTDPYKLYDNRPRSRDALAWLNRLAYYIPSIDSAFHFDYRFFADSWGVRAHTFETSLYKPIGNYITVGPRFRYYLQHGADFFTYNVPTDDLDRFISADMRLADFGGVAYGMKLIGRISQNLELDALYEYMQTSAELAFQGNDHVEDLGAHYVEVGLMVRF